MKIVDKTSATLDLPGSIEMQLPMPADHSSICKFDSTQDCGYVLKTISLEIDRALSPKCSGVAATSSPGATGNTHWVVPRSANTLFTGRSEEIERIAKAITAPADFQRRFILTGMGGLGKSEICLKVASRVRDQYVLSSIISPFPAPYLRWEISRVQKCEPVYLGRLIAPASIPPYNPPSIIRLSNAPAYTVKVTPEHTLTLDPMVLQRHHFIYVHRSRYYSCSACLDRHTGYSTINGSTTSMHIIHTRVAFSMRCLADQNQVLGRILGRCRHQGHSRGRLYESCPHARFLVSNSWGRCRGSCRTLSRQTLAPCPRQCRRTEGLQRVLPIWRPWSHHYDVSES